MIPLRSFNQQQQHALFLLVASLALADRLVVLIAFGLRYTGTDDVVFWTVAADMAKGIFREPFLYGQNYNPALESLAAVPLLWMQVPIQLAMPIATAVLAIAPFAAWSWWHARRKEWWPATLIAAVPLLLPVEWGLITSMTRGFVNGLAVVALLPACLLINRPTWRSAAIGAALMAALAVNPNALLFCLPFALAHAFSDGRPVRALAAMLAGALPISGLLLAAMRFYEAHPERVLHKGGGWMYTFHPGDLIPEALARLDTRMEWLCPLWWSNGHAIIYLLLISSAALFMSRMRAHGWAVIAALLAMLISFGFPKTADGTNHILFPYTRMFLALPVLLAWAAAAVPWRPTAIAWASHALLVLSPMAFAWKAASLNEVVDGQLSRTKNLPVDLVPVQQLRADAAFVAELARRERIDALIALWGPEAHRGLVLCYAGPLVQPGLPQTLFVGHDRRYWVRSGMRDAAPSRILFICGDDERWGSNAHRMPPVRLVPFRFGRGRLIEGNTLPVEELLHRLDFDLGPLAAPSGR